MATKTARKPTGKKKSSASSPKPLRVRAAKPLERKHPWVAAEAYLLVGLLELLAFTLKHGGRGAGKAVSWATTTGADHVKAKVNTRKWVRALEDGATLSAAEAALIVGKSTWGKPHYLCACGSAHRSVESLNGHLVDKHGDDPPPVRRPSVTRTATARTLGKLIVLDPGTPRRRPPKAHRSATKTEIAARYRPHITAIGKKAITVDGPSRKIAQAFHEFADQPPPRYLADFRAQLAGLEAALVSASASMGDYGRMLRVRKNIDPDVVNPRIRRMEELLEQAGAHAAGLISDFEVAYNLHIKAATGTVTPPTPGFFDKVG